MTVPSVPVEEGRRPRPVGWRTRRLAVGVRWLTRVTGMAQLALGLALWTGSLLALIPAHMIDGLLFVVLLEAQAALAARAGVSWPVVALAVVWGLIVPVFGMTQAQILPGDLHWIVKVAHLVVGLVAMALAERLARGVHATDDGATGGHQLAGRAMTVGSVGK